MYAHTTLLNNISRLTFLLKLQNFMLETNDTIDYNDIQKLFAILCNCFNPTPHLAKIH